MHDFESRLFHQAHRIKARTLWQPGGGDRTDSRRMRVAAALGVGIDVELDLTHAGVELLIQRPVTVFKGLIKRRIGVPHELRFTGGEAGVVAVVGADHLDLVDLDGGDIGGWRGDSRGGGGSGGGCEAREHRAESAEARDDYTCCWHNDLPGGLSQPRWSTHTC